MAYFFVPDTLRHSKEAKDLNLDILYVIECCDCLSVVIFCCLPGSAALNTKIVIVPLSLRRKSGLSLGIRVK